MSFRVFRWTAILAFVLCAHANAQESPSNLPDGPGKGSLQKACSTCHELESVIAARRTKIGWQEIIEDMVSRGAEGSDEEMAAVLSYLTAHYGKLNVNTASASDMEKTLSLPIKEAEAIVAYRERNGKIHDFEELKKIPEVNADKLQSKRMLIAFAQ